MPVSKPPPPLDSGGNRDASGRPQSPSSEGTEKRKAIVRKFGSTAAGMGAELAGTTLVLAGLGYLFDHYRGENSSTGLAIGGFVGFSLGMYRFILKALQQIEKPKE